MAGEYFELLYLGYCSIDIVYNANSHDTDRFAISASGDFPICVGAAQLGLKTAAAIALGNNSMGDFVLEFLQKQRVNATFSARKSGLCNSVCVVSEQTRNNYRGNCADFALTIDDMLAAPVSTSKILLLSGTCLSEDPLRSTALLAAEITKEANNDMVLSLDFKASFWHDPRAFSLAIRSILPLATVVIGTQKEIALAMRMPFAKSGVCPKENIERMLSLGPKAIVEIADKQGSKFHFIDHEKRTTIAISGFPVKINEDFYAKNAFIAGFLYGYAKKWQWEKILRLGSLCHAIAIDKGQDNSLPAMSGLEKFIENTKKQGSPNSYP